MKIKITILVLLMGFFCINSFTQNSPYTDYFGMGSRLGEITNNKVQFYEFVNNSWILNGTYDLELPNGHRGVFEWHDYGVAVIINNVVQIYEYIDNTWTLRDHLNLTLPRGYRGVFGLGGSFVGIVVNNRIQIYQRNSNNSAWVVDEIMGFKIPRGYSAAFGMGMIGVIANNRLQVYHTFGDIFDNFNFALPRGYRSIFRISTTNGSPTLGVVSNNGIQFFQFVNTTWVLNSMYNFTR